MIRIEDFDFKGKRTFVRVDFNVPLDEAYHITDDTRMQAALPTLRKVLSDGGKLIIGSHLGRPKQKEEKFSLRHLLPHLQELLGCKVAFVPDAVGSEVQRAIAELQEGEGLLLENLRYYAEEEGKPRGLAADVSVEEKAAAKAQMKERQKAFAQELAGLAEVYVNDAFGTAHRAHASTALMADHFDAEHKMFGYLLAKEVAAVDKLLRDIHRPFTAIMGGAKVSTKIGVIENLLEKVDNLIICGGMTHTFTKAAGGHVGNSIVEEDKLELAREIEKKAEEKGVRLILPVDTVCADSFSPDAQMQVVDRGCIPEGWEGLDIGPKTQALFAEVIKGSKTILWNGPAGVFEFDKFAKGSKAMGEAIAEATAAGAFSLVGGGDSVACVNKFGLGEQVSYVSTGGGALLEAIEGKELPGIAAIQKG